MNDSTDDTNELDSYGVWVKHSSSDNKNSDTFDDTDFSDMFKDDDQFSTVITENEIPSEDSTLTADELANIATTSETTEEDKPVEDIEIPDFFEEEKTSGEATEEETFEEPSIEQAVEEPITEEPVVDFTGNNMEEIDLSEFEEELDLDNIPDMAEQNKSEEIDLSHLDNNTEEDKNSEEEISLDDFLDDGFSDESVSAGKFSAEEKAAPSTASSNTEEISLDDFLDAGDDFGLSDTPAPQPKEEEEILDSKPLDMEISFDDSVETIQTEDNIETESETAKSENSEEENQSDLQNMEEVTFDSFSSSSEEEIDLSDFGIDANAEETAVTQDVQEAKTKEKIVDYDLSVGDDNLSSAPVVNEIKSDAIEQSSPTSQQSQPVVKPVVTENINNGDTETMDSATSSLLQQIAAELSSLKNEINGIKSDLASIKNGEYAIKAPEPEEIEIKPEEESTGFFGADDSDDTIALSGDELNNIMNTAEFSTAEITIPDEENTPENETTAFTDEPVVEEPVVEETTEEIFEEPKEESLNTEKETESETDVSVDDITVETVEEPVIEETITDIPNETAEENIDNASTFEEIFQEPEDEALVETTGENTFEDLSFDSFETPSSDETEIENLVVEAAPEMTEEEIKSDSLESETVDEITENPSEDIVEETIVEENPEKEIDITEGPAENESLDLPEEIVIEDNSDIPTVDGIFEENTDESLLGKIDESLGSVEEPADNNLEYNFEEENIEEPEINDIKISDDETIEESLPEEISIPTENENDILVESSENDFMDSIKEETEVEENVETHEDTFDILDETPVESISETENFDIPDIESSEVFEEPKTEETEIAEETAAEETETFVEEIAPDAQENSDNTEDVNTEDLFITEPMEEMTNEFVEEPSVEKEPEENAEESNESPEIIENIEPETVEETAVEPIEEAIEKEPESSISESDISYLSTEKEPESKGINNDLQQEIKSVLLYMDQLLENLPEEKIVEFAKSDEFTTYKKLFNDLGLV